MTFQASKSTKSSMAALTYMLERAPVDRYVVPTMTVVASKTRSGLEAAKALSTVHRKLASRKAFVVSQHTRATARTRVCV